MKIPLPNSCSSQSEPFPPKSLGKCLQPSLYLTPSQGCQKRHLFPLPVHGTAAYLYSPFSAGIAIIQTASAHLPIKVDFQIYRTLVLREVYMGNTIPP